MRQRIAQQAALLMAEHGIRDHTLAKRKAARQLGLEDRQALPDNDEIDAALCQYNALFAPESSAHELHQLRQAARAVMRQLARFNPYLCGALVSGAVTQHSAIELEIHADSSKALEQFLLNAGIPFDIDERPDASCYILAAEDAEVRIRVLPENARPSKRAGRKRLSLDQFEDQLAEALAHPLFQGAADPTVSDAL